MKYIALFLSLFAVCSCSRGETLPGKTFTLTDSPVVATLGFDAHENRFFGQVVNNYFGNYTASADTITFSTVGTTMMMGPRDEMDFERTYLDDLHQVQSYALQGDTLTLTLSDGRKLHFKAQP